jgi:hypothetical protein
MNGWRVLFSCLLLGLSVGSEMAVVQRRGQWLPGSGVKMHDWERFWSVKTGISLMFLFLPFT